MLTTEEEARRKRCVQALENAGNCVTAQCMAWRWFNAATPATYHYNVPTPDGVREIVRQGYEPDPNHHGGYRKEIRSAIPARGYCGLAGKPAAGAQ